MIANIPEDDTPQPLFDHLNELRRRLLWAVLAFLGATGISYLYAQEIYGFLVEPLAQAMGEGSSHRLIYTNLTEAFFTYLKVAMFTGAFITCPFVLIQIWLFVAPGLFPKEKKAVVPFLISAPLLFFAGGAIVYKIVLPMAWAFFLSFQSSGDMTTLPVVLEPRVGEYLDLVMVLIFAFGLCFQMPVVMGLLALAGLVTPEFLAGKRRYAIVMIFVVAAIITPPDVISQIALAIPLCLLYEISVWVVKRIHHDRHTT
ncbi:MAG: twin-arginine translocase subunit TatC [Pseudobdellovibrionaceae bacterium]